MTSKDKHDEDKSELVLDDELERELQPHLSHGQHGEQNGVSLDYINPALDVTSNENQTSNNHTAKAVETDNNRNETTGNGILHVSGSESYTVSSPPVHYSNATGQSTIIQEPVVIREPNGIHVIRTQQCCEIAPHRHRQKPLKIRTIKILQAFSIVAVFIFFPLGIPAMYYAFKCEQEFHAGVLRGDIDLARKLATRTERLIVFSVLGALMVTVIIFAVVERNLMAEDEDYWKTRSKGVVYPTG